MTDCMMPRCDCTAGDASVYGDCSFAISVHPRCKVLVPVVGIPVMYSRKAAQIETLAPVLLRYGFSAMRRPTLNFVVFLPTTVAMLQECRGQPGVRKLYADVLERVGPG